MPENRAKFHFDNVYQQMNTVVGPYILYQTGDLCCEPGYVVKPHRQVVHELTYTVSGSGVLLAGGREYPMRGGDLFFNRMDEIHAISSATDLPLRYYYLGFLFTPDAPPVLRQLEEFLAESRERRVERAQSVGEAFIRLFDELLTADALSGPLLEAAMQQVVCGAGRLFERREGRRYRAGERRDMDEKLAYDLLHYIDIHAHDLTDLSDLSREFGYSYTHLAQKFSLVTGETLHAYRNRRRFEKAQADLRAGLSVTKTAERLGYQSIHAFSRAFRRQVGIPPREYQRLAEANQVPSGPQTADME